MEQFIERLKQQVTVGLVGGSDLVKILEQLGGNDGILFTIDLLDFYLYLKYHIKINILS